MVIPVVPHKAVAEVSKIGNLWEIGGCESRMAERSHWSIYLSIYPSIYLSISLSSSLSISLSIYLSIYLSF